MTRDSKGVRKDRNLKGYLLLLYHTRCEHASKLRIFSQTERHYSDLASGHFVFTELTSVKWYKFSYLACLCVSSDKC